jgi:hypothetical protein
MTRLSLKVVYLWHHVSSTAPPFILWWWHLEILPVFAPLHCSSPFIGELRCQAIKMEHALIYQRGPKAQSILWDVCGCNPRRRLYGKARLPSSSKITFGFGSATRVTTKTQY